MILTMNMTNIGHLRPFFVRLGTILRAYVLPVCVCACMRACVHVRKRVYACMVYMRAYTRTYVCFKYRRYVYEISVLIFIEPAETNTDVISKLAYFQSSFTSIFCWKA